MIFPYELSFIVIFSLNFSNRIKIILKFLSDLHKTRSIATASQKVHKLKRWMYSVQQGYKPYPNT